MPNRAEKLSGPRRPTGSGFILLLSRPDSDHPNGRVAKPFGISGGICSQQKKDSGSRRTPSDVDVRRAKAFMIADKMAQIREKDGSSEGAGEIFFPRNPIKH